MVYYSEAEQIAWHNAQPRKLIAAKVIVENPAGQVLVVKPNYKPGWQFPGGIVEAGESPALAAQRETHEEIGLLLDFDRFSFLGPVYTPPKGEKVDFMHFMFSVTLTAEEVDLIKIQQEELDGHEFISKDKVPDYIQNPTNNVTRLWQQQLASAYLEKDGLVIPGPTHAD